MKRILNIYVLLLLAVVIVSLAFIYNMQPMRIENMRQVNVLIIHAYDNQLKEYDLLKDKVVTVMHKGGYEPDIKNIYLQVDGQMDNTYEHLMKERNKLKAANWTAEIIMTDGDRVVQEMLRPENDTILREWHRVPVIMGYMHYPDWDKLAKMDNKVVITDPIDYTTNIKMAQELTGSNSIVIELDYNLNDSIRREELRAALRQRPFVDNSDYHVCNPTGLYMPPQYKDSIVVTTLSVESPERNFPDCEDPVDSLASCLDNMWRIPVLSIKKDMYSNELVRASSRPQFTAVKADFGENNGNYLSGYFTSQETVGKDLAECAVQILNGTQLEAIGTKEHEKGYYMDYIAMKRLNMPFFKYSRDYEIINAPLYLSNPLNYGATLIAGMSFLVLVIYITVFFVIHWRQKYHNKLMERLQDEQDLNILALNGADSSYVNDINELLSMIRSVHPDYRKQVEEAKKALRVSGPHKIRLFAAIKDDMVYEWWEARIVVNVHEKKRNNTEEEDNEVLDADVFGIMVNIQDIVKREKELQLAHDLAEEAKKKENFLMKMNHEIRTPMNTIIGMADLMSQLSDDCFSPEEKEMYRQALSDNSKALTILIYEILAFSKIESGRQEYLTRDMDIAQFVRDSFTTWEQESTDKVTIKMEVGRDDIIVCADKYRMEDIITHFMNNALKFTPEGYIIMGWRYYLNSCEVELFIEDTGIGIPADKIKYVFSMFWKNDEFVPGIGLGLNIAKSYTEAMGGRLQVESQQGVGTRFSVFLPARVGTKQSNS